jgi:hypothetical protein
MRLNEMRTMVGRNRMPRVTLIGRIVRGRRFDHNPVRRASDRAETVVLALLAVAFLVGAPLAALASGAWAHAVAHRDALAQVASRRLVAVVVLAEPTSPQMTAGYLATMAQARWTAPDGAVVKGQLPVPYGTQAGATFRLWSTLDGHLTGQPMNDAQVASVAALAEAGGAAGVALALAAAGGLARWSFNRRRMAAWDVDWQATGPRWTTRA